MAQESLTGLGFNVGTEWSLQLVVNGQIINELGLIETTDRKVTSNLIEVIPSNNNGDPVRRTTWHGFPYSYSMVRQDDSFDDLVDAFIDAYKSQSANPELQGTETIINNGVVSEWTYLGGTFVADGLGNIKGADKVDGITFTIHWSSRVKTTGGSSAPDLTTDTDQ